MRLRSIVLISLSIFIFSFSNSAFAITSDLTKSITWSIVGTIPEKAEASHYSYEHALAVDPPNIIDHDDYLLYTQEHGNLLKVETAGAGIYYFLLMQNQEKLNQKLSQELSKQNLKVGK